MTSSLLLFLLLPVEAETEGTNLLSDVLSGDVRNQEPSSICDLIDPGWFHVPLPVFRILLVLNPKDELCPRLNIKQLVSTNEMRPESQTGSKNVATDGPAGCWFHQVYSKNQKIKRSVLISDFGRVCLCVCDGESWADGLMTHTLKTLQL